MLLLESGGSDNLLLEQGDDLLLENDGAGATVSGVAESTVTVTSTAVGTRVVLGVAANTVTVTSTATGTRVVAGVAANTVTVTSTATGTRVVLGVAASTVTVTSTADGTIDGQEFGTAASTVTVTSTATGTRVVLGTAASTVTVTSTATGTVLTTRNGVASSEVTITSTAVGTGPAADVVTGAQRATGWRGFQALQAATIRERQEDLMAPLVACPRDGEPLDRARGVAHCGFCGSVYSA